MTYCFCLWFRIKGKVFLILYLCFVVLREFYIKILYFYYRVLVRKTFLSGIIVDENK
jgi:hypothetical protein